MSIETTARSKVIIDSQQAEEEIKQLTNEVKKYRDAMNAATKANDKAAFDKAEQGWKRTKNALKGARQELFSVDAVMKNLSGSSMNQLRAAQRAITAELNKMTRGTAEYTAKSKQLRMVGAEIRKVRTEMTGLSGAQSGMFGKMANGFNKYFGLITGAVAALTGLSLGLRKVANDAMEFDAKVANLGAITGLAGENLDWLKEKAKELSISVTDDGVRITKSADEIVDAFTLMGSAKPELLENKDALAAVTTEALKLAEAAKMDTSVAVESLANVMNQFGAEADQASKFINVLAAGSKAGSAMVDQIADSIIRFGPAAASANVSVEESVALIETLAEKGVKGERAGTALRTALLKLQTGTDEFNPKVVGLNQALENLNNANLSAGDLVKLFGQEAYTAGAILVENVDRVEHFTKAVTNSNIATEQAIKNTEHEQATLAQKRNELKLITMELGQKLAPAFSSVTLTTTKFIRLIATLVPWLQENWRIIASLATAIAAYTIAIKATAVAKQIYTRVTNLATMATEAFNNATRKNLIGVFAAALAAAISYFIIFRRKADESTTAVKELTEAQRVFNTLMESTKSIEERMAIIGTLSKRQAEILKEDIETQLRLEEDYTSKLLTELKTRLDGDTQLNDLKKQFSEQEFDYLKAGIQNRINIRKEELAGDLQAQHNSQKERIESLKGYLNQVATLKFEKGSPLAPDYETLKTELDDYLATQRLATQRSYLQGEIDKETKDSNMQVLEVAHLEALLALQKQYGEQTYDTEYKLTEEKIKLMESVREANRRILDQMLKDNEVNSDKLIEQNKKDTDAAILAEFEAYDAEVEAKRKANEEKAQLDQQAFDAYAQKMEQYKAVAGSMASALGNLLGRAATDAEMTAQDVARELMLIALDSLHGIVQIAMAEVWTKAIAQGPLAIAGAIAKTAAIEMVFAGVKAAVSNVGQRYAGKYDVIGEDDGRTYRQVPYQGDMRTGIYSQPTLVGERGSELVVDAGTLRNVSVNFPDVLPKIRASMVPQRAAGNVAERTAANSQQPIANGQQSDPELKALLYNINQLFAQGIAARIEYSKIEDANTKVSKIRRDVSRS